MALMGTKIEHRRVLWWVLIWWSFNEAVSQEDAKPAQFGLEEFKNPC